MQNARDKPYTSSNAMFVKSLMPLMHATDNALMQCLCMMTSDRYIFSHTVAVRVIVIVIATTMFMVLSL